MSTSHQDVTRVSNKVRAMKSRIAEFRDEMSGDEEDLARLEEMRAELEKLEDAEQSAMDDYTG